MKMLIKMQGKIVGVKNQYDDLTVTDMFEYFIGLLRALGYQEGSIADVLNELLETYNDNIK